MRRAWVLVLVAAAACSTTTPTDTAIEIGISYSRFTPPEIRVAAGSTVTFTLRNDDPIAHEFIIGTLEEQAEHERGTDTTHDGAPGAASLEPGETQTVTFTFDASGALEYACHLPGHYAYGMRGAIDVV